MGKTFSRFGRYGRQEPGDMAGLNTAPPYSVEHIGGPQNLVPQLMPTYHLHSRNTPIPAKGVNPSGPQAGNRLSFWRDGMAAGSAELGAPLPYLAIAGQHHVSLSRRYAAEAMPPSEGWDPVINPQIELV